MLYIYIQHSNMLLHATNIYISMDIWNNKVILWMWIPNTYHVHMTMAIYIYYVYLYTKCDMPFFSIDISWSKAVGV